MPAAVELDGLTHSYGGRVALDSLSLSVRRGELFALLGHNGSGKTTLFRILSTLMTPSGAGRVTVCGTDPVADPAAVRRRIGVVFQAPSLDRKLTARENLVHQGHLYGLSGADLRARIARALDAVGMTRRADERVERLSGGMQRRIEVAKALLHDPELLLLDEPSTGLDPGARRDLREELAALRDQRGVTCLLTTHLMDEAETCDRVAILDHGRLAALGTPEELKTAVGGEVVTLESHDPAGLARAIAERFDIAASAVGSAVRIEVPADPARPPAARLLIDIVEAFPGLVVAARVGRPSLEDAFIHFTGHRFYEEPAESAA
jgi:ABC-2 type transport system ATP-binding protein